MGDLFREKKREIMEPRIIHRSSLRKKPLDVIDKYLALSDRQSISVGIYINGSSYIIDFNQNEAELSYDIGSLSKTITGHLILKLANQGLIDLYAPVSRYIHLKSGKYPSIYQLMTHTAGYSHLTPPEITLPMLMRHRYSFRNPYEKTGRKDVIKALERRRNCKTGGYHYSDFPFAILATVAENVTGTEFSQIIENFIISDLGLSNTHIIRSTTLPCAMCGKRSIPYWIWNKDNPYIAAGGITSNIYDMLKYITLQAESSQEYITEGHKICPESFSEKGNVGTCLCWHTYKNSDQLWHVGGVGTFRSSLIVNKHRRIGVAVLGNSKGVSSANVHYIAKMLYSELKLKKIRI